MIPDTVFIVLGVLPIAAAGIWGMLHMRKADIDSPNVTSPGASDAIEELMEYR
jgi:hypothetical protein